MTLSINGCEIRGDDTAALRLRKTPSKTRMKSNTELDNSLIIYRITIHRQTSGDYFKNTPHNFALARTQNYLFLEKFF